LIHFYKRKFEEEKTQKKQNIENVATRH